MPALTPAPLRMGLKHLDLHSFLRLPPIFAPDSFVALIHATSRPIQLSAVRERTDGISIRSLGNEDCQNQFPSSPLHAKAFCRDRSRRRASGAAPNVQYIYRKWRRRRADYVDLETAIVKAPANSTLLVYPGTYTAHPSDIDATASVFWINKPLTLLSVGGPTVTTLAVPMGQYQNVLISSSNVRVEGFTLKNGQFCADAQDFLNNTTLTNIVLKNLNIIPDAVTGDGHGILYEQTCNSVIDNCTVGMSYANGIFLDHQSNNDIVMNSTVNGTMTQHGIAIKNSNNDQLLNNTVTASHFDGIILVTGSNNRIIGNNISGHTVDGITVTEMSDFNYVAQNTIVSNGLASGRTAGTGIWLNNESDGNTVYANTMSGSPENGIAVFVSSNNLISGNEIFGNHEGGIFVWDAQGDSRFVGHAPTNTIIVNNYIHDNTFNAAVNLRGAIQTDVEHNYISGAFTGVYGSSTDGGLIVQRAVHTQFIGNTMVNLQIGEYIYPTGVDVQIFRNREINVGNNYAFRGAVGVHFDAGVNVGGNFWSGQKGKVKKGYLPAYTKFIYDARGRLGGGFKDAFPFADETLGAAYSVTVTNPAAGSSIASGSKQVIQWTSTASVLVDIYYSSSETGDVLIAANRPDIGVYPWTVPSLVAGSDYVIKVIPKNSAGVVKGAAGVSGTFSAEGSGNLNLLSPARDAVAAPGGTLRVAWEAAVIGTPVDVDIQTDGGAWTPLASAVTDSFVNVTLPNVTTTQARFRIRDHVTGAASTQEGFFRIGNVAAVTTPAASMLIGANQPLAWISPANTTTVDIDYWTGKQWRSIASRMPDVGHFLWFVPETATSAATIRVTFHDATDAQIGTATSSAFTIKYPLAHAKAVHSVGSAPLAAPLAMGTPLVRPTIPRNFLRTGLWN